ncbi:hypothetical protein [Actinoplanes regularis]|uniref:hypothetical protein n=1 Tax=Actinoplanes regularis TaxID=52697 RepID=UPI0024A1DC70|nr:hypothetical protein [Actinoplanes regularis]GLW29095.1 hypothetical protein Areg01_20350 [Actinoplanes regularis]
MTAHGRNSARFHARRLALAGDLSAALDLETDISLALARTLTRTRNHDWAQAHAHALAKIRARRPDLISHLSRARNLALAVAADADSDLAQERARALAGALKRAYRTAEETNEQGAGVALRQRRATLRRPVPSSGAVRLVRGAARVLPAEHRYRYREEFESELYELTVAGASRWAQLAYGVRLLDRAWVLRAELREAATRWAST